MATGQPPSPDTTQSRLETSQSVVPLEDQLAKPGSLDHEALAYRRVEIEGNEKLKLQFKDWEDAKKENLLKIEIYRGRCIAAMTELYQLLGFYSVFQGVVFSAVSSRSKLSCLTASFPFLLSLLTSIATAISVHYKLTSYETEKLKFIRAEWDVSSLIKKINKLKGQGNDFKFEEIDDPNSDSKKKAKALKLAEAVKDHSWFYRAAMTFLFAFSSIILISCFVVLCVK